MRRDTFIFCPFFFSFLGFFILKKISVANSVFGEEDEVTSVGRESPRKPRFHSEPGSRVHLQQQQQK